MMTKSTASPAQTPGSRSWCGERSFAFILALTLAVYFLRVTLLPVFGEEPRRAVIAREMLATGDWIVPRVQGVPRMSRPPLQNWMIAAASQLTGSIDVWAIRLPSLLATLVTVALVYGYSYRRAGETVAVLAATAYVSMYEVLEYGRLGETEAVFTAFVAASLLLWHWGNCEGWNPWLTWPLCYLLVACGMLTKGLQAPLYFSGAVGITLLTSRRQRELGSLPHLCGLVVLMVVVGAWQLAFIRQLGWSAGWEIYSQNVMARFIEPTNDSFLVHLALYPFEVFAVMLPGSLLLIPAASPVVRARLVDRRPMIFFLVSSTIWAFLFVWLPPGGRARYFMPMMPLLAVLMGLVGEAWMRVPWHSVTPASRRRIAIGIGLAAAAIYVGPILSIQAKMCDNIEEQVADLKHHLPAGERLFSLDQLHHGFLYYYGEEIPLIPWPDSAEDVPDDLRYFAIHTHNSDPPPLPFAWKELNVITCDRYERETPRVKIHIGRRIDGALDVARPTDGWRQ
jgi:4-amino-4-deoxy-L-arabinose transferase-like glycosyltransferase